MPPPDGNRTAVREVVAGSIIKMCDNKRRILGLEWSMSEDGTPPPNNSDKPRGLVVSNIHII